VTLDAVGRLLGVLLHLCVTSVLYVSRHTSVHNISFAGKWLIVGANVKSVCRHTSVTRSHGRQITCPISASSLLCHKKNCRFQTCDPDWRPHPRTPSGLWGQSLLEVYAHICWHDQKPSCS